MKNMKKLFALVLALALCFSLAIPAMADDTTTGGGDPVVAPVFDITIKQDTEQQQVKHTYEAYQIFSGEISKNAQGVDILSTIEWGDGIDAAKFLAKLVEDATYGSYFQDGMNAEQVADAIAKAYSEKGSAFSFALRHIMAECLTTPVGESELNKTEKLYIIDNVAPGYYFIKDKDGSLDGETSSDPVPDSYTNYILEVVGDTNVTPKGGTVEDDKDILNGNVTTDVMDYSIGDTVTFILNGSLPANYGNFTTFEYHFVDTMSEGLTFNPDSVEVYVENNGSSVKLTEGYVVNDKTPSVLGATFTVDFANLKDITSVEINANSEIEVVYTATLNEEAEIGNPGNKNSSYVIFSNDPHSDSTGKTTPNYTFVFTWELDNTKIDGQTAVALAEAKFVLYRGSVNKEYVKLDGYHKVTGWTADKSAATVMVSAETGRFDVIGLDAGTYYLEEVESPNGYHLLDKPVTVIIASALGMKENGVEAEATSLTIKVGTNGAVNGDKDAGVVEAVIANNPGAHLPETGGVGTTMFYIAGGIMVAAAAVLLIAKKRKVEE